MIMPTASPHKKSTGSESNNSDHNKEQIPPLGAASVAILGVKGDAAAAPARKRTLPPGWITQQDKQQLKEGRGEEADSLAPPKHQQQRPPVALLRPFRYGGAISYVSHPSQSQCFEGMELLQEALRQANSSSEEGQGVVVMGFDLEWTTRFVARQSPGKTAVVQLALGGGGGSQRPPGNHHNNRIVYVFHIAHLQQDGRYHLPPLLASVLCCERIKKVGCGVANDVNKLGTDLKDVIVTEEGGGGLRGFWELSDLAHVKLGPAPGNGSSSSKWSLQDLVGATLQQRLDKPPHIRTGNWDKKPLHHDQLSYAATDAWASLRVYESLAALSTPGTTTTPLIMTDINYTYRPRPPLPPALPADSKRAGGGGGGDEDGGTTTTSSSSGELEQQLAPSKREAYQLWRHQGLTLRQVAEAKGGLKPGTIASYLAEAISLGCPYDWHRMREEIGPDLVAQVEAAYSRAAEAEAEQGEDQGGEGGGRGPRLGEVRRALADMPQQQPQGAAGAAAAGGQQQQCWWEVGLIYRHLQRGKNALTTATTTSSEETQRRHQKKEEKEEEHAHVGHPAANKSS